MRDVDKIVQYLSGFVSSSKVLEYMERPSPLFNDRCILDLLKEESAEQVIKRVEEALDHGH